MWERNGSQRVKCDLIDVLADKAEEMSSDLELISTNHEEGERLSNMTGIAAILRYRIR